MTTTDRVLSDFVDAWNAGRRPRAREYLARLPDGPQRDELAERIATFLELAPAPDLGDAGRAAVRAEPAVARVLAGAGREAGVWPAVVPRLRERAGLSVGDVAARLVEQFGLRRGDQPRAAAYVERLERGDLEPARVSRRLLDALGGMLGSSGAALADAAGFGRALRPAGAAGTLFRAQEGSAGQVAADIDALSRAAFRPAAPEHPDELDALFTGGPDA